MLLGSMISVMSISAFAAKDIVDIAVRAGSFTTLVKALKAADLVATLKGVDHILFLHLLMKHLQKYQKLI